MSVPSTRIGPRTPLIDGTIARLTAVLAVLLGLAGLLAWLLWPQSPTQLAQMKLVGTRGPGCVELVVLADNSGSMTQYASQRAAAVSQLQAWSVTNLRTDDRFALIDWANDAQLSLPADSMSAPRSQLPADPAVIGSGSTIGPALAMVGAMPKTACRISLLVISDGLIVDTADPEATRVALAAAGVQNVVLFNPAADSAPAEWTRMVPYSRTVPIDITRPDSLALTLGQAVADATGQRLESR